jgi:hypothetical protein
MGIRPFIIHINLGGVLKITPDTKASDYFQSKDSGQRMCIDTLFGKNRPQERETKWFQEEREPRNFQGGEEEVEEGGGGGRIIRQQPFYINEGYHKPF